MATNDNNSKLKNNEKYTFNNESQKYIFHCKDKFGKNYVFPANVVDNIIKLYSNFDDRPSTMGDISLKLKIPKDVVKFILGALNVTHDTIPFSEETIVSSNEDDLVDEMLAQKKFSILQKFEKEDWKATEEDANKWRQFKTLTLNPFENFLSSWNPPTYKRIYNPKKESSDGSGRVMIINVADIHVGTKADERYLYRQKNWKHEDLVSAMKDYAAQLKSEVSNRKYNFDTAYLTLGGDIIHTLTGQTDNGTQLIYEFLGEDQLDYAFTLLVIFINEILAIFPKVEVKQVSGNHSTIGDYTIGKLLSVYYKDESRINFELSTKRYLPFKVKNSLVILDHGASGKGIKSKLPSGEKRTTYIQNILLDKPDLLLNLKDKIFITNDQHHYEMVEREGFTMIMCPSIVGGDMYSDINGWKSRPSQCIFVVDDNGLRDTIRLYFD